MTVPMFTDGLGPDIDMTMPMFNFQIWDDWQRFLATLPPDQAAQYTAAPGHNLLDGMPNVGPNLPNGNPDVGSRADPDHLNGILDVSGNAEGLASDNAVAGLMDSDSSRCLTPTPPATGLADVNATTPTSGLPGSVDNCDTDEATSTSPFRTLENTVLPPPPQSPHKEPQQGKKKATTRKRKAKDSDVIADGDSGESGDARAVKGQKKAPTRKRKAKDLETIADGDGGEENIQVGKRVRLRSCKGKAMDDAENRPPASKAQTAQKTTRGCKVAASK